MHRITRHRHWFPAAAALLLAAVGLGGCQTPDLAPFAESSTALAQHVRQGGELTTQAMLLAPYHDAEGRLVPPSDATHPAREFADLWDDRRRAVDAIAAYSAGLAAIAEGGQQGQARISELAQTVAGLGQLMPSLDRPLREGISIGEMIAQTALSIQTARALHRAVEHAHPALAGIAEILRADIRELQWLHTIAMQTLERDVHNQYGPMADYRRSLIAERDEARQAFARALPDGDRAAVESLDELIAATDPEFAAYDAAIAQLTADRRNAAALFGAIDQALDAWLAAHLEIQRALRDQRQPSATRLVIIVEEIRVIADRLRDRD